MKTDAKILAKNRGYYSRNRKKVLAQKKVWYAANRNQKRSYNQRYYADGREELTAAQRVYYGKNKTKVRAAQKEYLSVNRTRVLARRRDRNYGMSTGDFDALVLKQEGACAICNQRPKKKLCVDHCHASGTVRGLLCFKCNFAIGQLGDSSERALSAHKYLKSHGK